SRWNTLVRALANEAARARTYTIGFRHSQIQVTHRYPTVARSELGLLIAGDASEHPARRARTAPRADGASAEPAGEARSGSSSAQVTPAEHQPASQPSTASANRDGQVACTR